MLRSTRLLCLTISLFAWSAPFGDSQIPGRHRTSSKNSEQTQAAPGAWGDQGDGTYVNPVMPGDFSDLDAIRVGDDFYAISSTLQYSPGMAVLHSRDLANWEMVGHVVDDVTRIDPELNWDRMNRAGRGIWAGSIRYHAGRYRVYFGTPDQGIFVSTARTPAGPWTPVKTVISAAGWDDPCPFWDDDGQGYLVATRFLAEKPGGPKYNIHLFKLNGDNDHLLPGYDRVIHQSQGSEANKLYKINGLYYHYFSHVLPEGRVAMMERAESLDGPWQIRQLQHVNPKVDKEPNQGGLIELSSGKWYFVSHQGTGDWEGRAGVLLPVTWIDGWPIIGSVGSDGVGNMVWRDRKPIDGQQKSTLAASDDFNEDVLKPNWEWNYQPRADRWSLHTRPGYLRLQAFASLRDGEFRTIGNLLTQRSMRTRRNEVTARFDLTGLTGGGQGGLAHFAKTFCTFGIEQQGTVRRLMYNNNGQIKRGPIVKSNTLWLRSTWHFDGLSHFSYSLDGKRFTAFGGAYPLTWGAYRGDRIGVFVTGSTGYLDVDSFRYTTSK